MKTRTMYEKIWEAHLVRASADEVPILYIDTHLVHEVTSPQAFEGLRLNNRKVRRPDLTFATMDHNVPTTDRSLPITDLIAAKQMEHSQKTALSSTSRSTILTVLSRASSMSLDLNLASRSPAQRLSAVIAIPQRTVRWAHSHSVSARARLNMYSPRNASCNRNRRPLRFGSMEHSLTA